jgi:hypothetical protein
MFQKLIHKMNTEGLSVTKPRCFQDYLKEIGINKQKTAQYISIDTLNRLDPELKQNKIMVFRLGQQKDNKTFFALAKSNENWSDYFLTNESVSNTLNAEERSIDLKLKFEYELKPFRALPTWTESSSVNAIVGLGLLNEFLELDDLDFRPIPATARSSADFEFKINSNTDLMTHKNGQIEIDQLIYAKRNGEPFYFLIEAKHGASWKNNELAKHKLFYPGVAISKATNGHPIVPIYLNTYIEDACIQAQITECSSIRYKNTSEVVLSDLKPIKTIRACFKF